MGLFGGRQGKTNVVEFSAACHIVDSSGDRKVLTEQQDRSYCFRLPKVKRIEKNSNDKFGCLFI